MQRRLLAGGQARGVEQRLQQVLAPAKLGVEGVDLFRLRLQFLVLPRQFLGLLQHLLRLLRQFVVLCRGILGLAAQPLGHPRRHEQHGDRQGDNQHGANGQRRDGCAAGARRRLPAALVEQAPLGVLHACDEGAGFIHELCAATGLDHRQCRRFASLPPQTNRVAEFFELRMDHSP